MPPQNQTDDTVRVISPTGQAGSIPRANLQKAIAKGYKAAPEHSDFVKGFAQASGLSSPDVTWRQVAGQTYGNTKKNIGDELSSLRKSLGEEDGIPVIGTPFTDVLAVPHLIARGAEGLASGFETAGKDLMTPGKRERGAGELLSTGAQTAGGLEGARAITAAKEGMERGAVTATREAFGVDEASIQKARDAHNAELADLEKQHEEKVQSVGKKTAADEAAYKTKVEHAKDEYARKVAERNQKMIDQSKQQSAANVKRDATGAKIRSGPAYQRLTQMADNVGESVGKLDKTVREAYNARWNAFHQAMGDAQGNFTPVQQAVSDAETNILKGSPENIAIFRNIMKEGEDPLLSQASVFKGASRGTDIKELLGSMRSEGERTRFLNSLKAEDPTFSVDGSPVAKENAVLPIDQIRGYSTELGNKIYRSGNISGDVRRALKSVKDAADKEVERVADSKGQGSTYRQLNKDWAQYMDDFYEHDGPLYKMKNALNSDRRIALISGGEGGRVIDSLGRYSRFDPNNVETVGRVRSMVNQIDNLSSRPGPVPPPVARPTFPARPAARDVPPKPAMPEFNLPKFVQDAVDQKAKQLGTTGHAVIAYSIMRDLFHGRRPSVAILAAPIVQRSMMRYLTSPKFAQRLQGMVQR
jgi:hypothetical protein